MPLNDDSLGSRYFGAIRTDADESNDSDHVERPVDPDHPDANIYEQIRRFLRRPVATIRYFDRRIGAVGPRGVICGAGNLLRKTHEQLDTTRRVDGSMVSQIEMIIALYERMDRYLPHSQANDYTVGELRWFSVFGEVVCQFETRFDDFFRLVVDCEGGKEDLNTQTQVATVFEQEASVASASDD